MRWRWRLTLVLLALLAAALLPLGAYLGVRVQDSARGQAAGALAGNSRSWRAGARAA